MDVHPPLAKLLITLAGWLAGFDGEFDFKDIGKDYLEPGVPYVAMRLLPAILGVLTVPLMFLTLKATGCRTSTAVMGAVLVTFDNALTTQSRFILLDSPLVFFTALTALSFLSFTNQHEQGPSKAFRGPWWFWLALTGLSLGATLSVKWVGLFTTAWVGSLTVLQLWVLLGDTRTVTPRLWFKHFFARFFCLIIIPIGFYVGTFAIHFLCLVNPGDGDGFMSPEFQATLNSKGMQDVPADVAFGSRVTIRHLNTQGGYLHSHGHMYPTGSKQQQVTLYPHKDENNLFLIENATQPLGPYGEVQGPFAWDNLTAEYIQDGATIRLYHLMTHRRIHSHDIRPPITEADWQNEVSAYGYEGFPGDANDLFRVEIVKSMSEGEEAKKRLRTIQTKFKLIHLMTGCTLFSHKVKLPDWGWEQQEVTCARGGTLPNSIWYIESNEHPTLREDSEKVNYRNPGFLGKFWELQRVMWVTNAGLVESHAWDSRPPSWPTLLRGINFWGRDHRQVYLIGNPLIWWSSSLAIAIYVIFKGIAILRWQRSYGDYQNITFKRFDYEIGTTALAWAFHYFPFYLMARQLFLHHYLPALYFAIMALSQMFDFVLNRIQTLGLSSRPAIGKAVVAIFLAFSIAIFTIYSPLAYGNPWTRDACRRAKLLDSWDFDCNTFYTDLSQYTTQFVNIQSVPKQSPVAQALANQQVLKDGSNDGVVIPQPGQPHIIGREERVEYRDQEGNLLDEEQVASLKKEGKVSFETKYETQTRVIDAHGRVHLKAVEHAPPHPDVEGQNPQTGGKGKGDESAVGNKPASAAGQDRSVRDEDQPGKPKPASEGNEATKQQ
ncbi:Dolichyl-phosphate-mannose-protein mannosyltransferase [Rasamsonia emersonii CBS 393.64]|uniref:Dolichyl-phosphate-mannose--protein mannosyltransferase n=1 Tax=Rasamsonia emersonii (strain ATCC 16479 / CBS 393.64 / IMI 116815) TaxID=1408163 RepID=A0A0F4YGK4_RASE3|nr:Dolichyl-phosphate-mannose-protein mannosyltransferase [Rasamsonia emersonii CBS 393.64]KKA17081.1 Dolichyl-phosphate-mannose-protein mannosyltransferase [Rasamsonia emersonii CBS 393.64]